MAWGQHNTLNLNHPKKQLFVCMFSFYLFKKHVIGVIWMWFFFFLWNKRQKWSYSKCQCSIQSCQERAIHQSMQWLPFCASAEDGMRHTLVFSIQAAVCQLVAVGRVNSLNTLGLKTMLLFFFIDVSQNYFLCGCGPRIFFLDRNKNLASFQH